MFCQPGIFCVTNADGHLLRLLRFRRNIEITVMEEHMLRDGVWAGATREVERDARGRYHDGG
jgi:hypothetical protein